MSAQDQAPPPLPTQLAAEMDVHKAELASYVSMSDFERVQDKLEATELRLHEADTIAIQLRTTITSLEVELRQVKRKLARTEEPLATRQRHETIDSLASFPHTASVDSASKRRKLEESLDHTPFPMDGLPILAPVAQAHSQRKPTAVVLDDQPEVFLISSSPPSPARSPSPIQHPHRRTLPAPAPAPDRGSKRGRSRIVEGDDADIPIILLIGKAPEPTAAFDMAKPPSDRYMALSGLEPSQHKILLDALDSDFIKPDDIKKAKAYKNIVSTSRRAKSVDHKNCIAQRLYNRNYHLQADERHVSCRFCRRSGHLCARVVKHEDEYKLAIFPRPPRDGVKVGEAMFWLKIES